MPLPVIRLVGLVRGLVHLLIALSGGEAQSFKWAVQQKCPGAKVADMLHYAHRNGRDAEQARVRDIFWVC